MSKKRRNGHKRKPKVPLSKRINARPKDGRADSASQLRSQLRGYGANDDVPKSLGSGAKGGVLSSPDNSKETKRDLALVERAVRERWGIKNKQTLQHRLMDVVQKTSVQILTKAGPFDSEADADANAISACRVLVQMDGMDQADDHFEVNKGKPATPGVNVNVFNSQPGQSRILQLAASLGATELVIDGSAVPITDSAGEPEKARTVQPKAGKQVGQDSALAQARDILRTDR